MEYMRDNLEDAYHLAPLQDKILYVAKYIDTFCKENGIKYCLMGGSALGAKRHGGFIPWDDDLDIFMTPDNFEKFRELFNQKGDKERFYLQQYGLTKDGHVTLPKLRMNNTTYIEELTKDYKAHHGIYVDIFILHNCPNSRLKQLWQCFWAKCVIVKGLSMRSYDRQKGLTKAVLTIAKILPKKLMVDYGLRQVYRYRNSDTNYYCNFLGKAVFKKGIYKKEWFEESVAAPFEKTTMQVPKGLHEFLSERFGDYMQVPSPERIKYEQHAWKWDTEKDFSNYVNKERDFSEEHLLI